MKKIAILVAILYSGVIFAQEMNVHLNNGTLISYPLSQIDSITFNSTSVSTEGLVAYYPFNQNTNDESGNGNNGSIFGGVTYTTDRHGNDNKAVLLNGTDGYILVPNSSSLQSPVNAITITGWIWIDGYDGLEAACIVNKANNSSYQYGLTYQEWSSPIICLLTQPNGVCAPRQLDLSNWYFIAATYDGNNMIIYVDGVNIFESAATGQITVDDSPLTLGIDTPGQVEYLKGKIDDIRIYNRSLSSDEVYQLFQER